MSIAAIQEYLINGSREATLSPLDRGFAYGDGIFRTLAIENGKPIRWKLHYAKLLHDCNALGIVCPAEHLLLADIERLCGRCERAVAKIIVTRGEGARGYVMPSLAQPTRVVIKAAYPDYPSHYFDQGVRLFACTTKLGHQPKLAGIKHLNRLENILARAEWSSAEMIDGLMTDIYDNVIECTMSNVFARFGTKLCTPDLRHCGVAGVTRQQVLAIASEVGLDAEVVHIPMTVLMDADEVLICNSLFGVLQVVELKGREWQHQPLAADLRDLLQG